MNTEGGEQPSILQSLEQLEHALRDLPYQTSPPRLSHYRLHTDDDTATDDVHQSYTLLHQGATLLHATATKYTLLKKLDTPTATSSQYHTELLQGCVWCATACTTVCDDSVGCARSTRYFVRRAVRGLVAAVRNVLLLEQQPTAVATGAVWDACNGILQQLPHGNRNCMRRDLLSWQVECQDTLREFTEAAAADCYTTPAAEQNMVQACLCLLKCSRGTLKTALAALEDASATSDTTTNGWVWSIRLHDHARAVGEGVTDLGTCMYAPIIEDVEELTEQVERQVTAMERTLQWVLNSTYDSAGDDDDDNTSSIEYPTTLGQETLERAVAIAAAIPIRKDEFMTAAAAAAML